MFVCLYFYSLLYLEMCTDHVNNTPTLLTIVNTMSILFFWSYGYIFSNYHIWKCAQTMLTLLQLSTTVCIMSILFLPFFPWFSSYVCINCHIRKCAQTTWTQYFSVPHRFLQDSQDSWGFPRIPQDSSGLLYHFGDFESVETNIDKSPGLLRTGTEFLLN